MAFLFTIIGVALLTQVAVSTNAITSHTNVGETMDMTAARINASYIGEWTINLSALSNINISVPSYGKQLYEYSNLTVMNASDGGEVPAAFVAANMSINLTDGSFYFNTNDSAWNVTAVNLSYNFVSYYVNESTNVTPSTIYDSTSADYVSGWRTTESGCSLTDVIGRVTVTNGSGTALTNNVDYIISTDGFRLQDTTAINTSTPSIVVSTSTCPDDYLTQGWSRNILTLIPGFFALAILGVGLWLFYSIGKDFSLF